MTTVVPNVLIGKVASLVTVTAPPQLSVAVGGVKLVSSHSAMMSAKVATSATGAVVSVITTFCGWVDEFPCASV